MTTINDLSHLVAGRLGIDPDAARDALDTYASQIEALESRTIDRDDITDDDAGFLADAVAAAQRAGDLGRRELAALEEAVADCDRAAADMEHAQQMRDAAIRAARAAGVPRKTLVEVTGLSPARIAQIYS